MLLTFRTKKIAINGRNCLSYWVNWVLFLYCEWLWTEQATILCTNIHIALYVWASLGLCVRAFLKWSTHEMSLGVNKIESSANPTIWQLAGGAASGALLGIPYDYLRWGRPKRELYLGRCVGNVDGRDRVFLGIVQFGRFWGFFGLFLIYFRTVRT